MKTMRLLMVLAIGFMSVTSMQAQGQRINEFQNEFSKYQAQYVRSANLCSSASPSPSRHSCLHGCCG